MRRQLSGLWCSAAPMLDGLPVGVDTGTWIQAVQRLSAAGMDIKPHTVASQIRETQGQPLVTFAWTTAGVPLAFFGHGRQPLEPDGSTPELRFTKQPETLDELHANLAAVVPSNAARLILALVVQSHPKSIGFRDAAALLGLRSRTRRFRDELELLCRLGFVTRSPGGRIRATGVLFPPGLE